MSLRVNRIESNRPSNGLGMCMHKASSFWRFLACVGGITVLIVGAWTLCFSSSDSASPNTSIGSDDGSGCSQGGLAPSGTVEASEFANVAISDIVPVRSVADPYPSLHSVVVDPDNNRVLMSDSNRGGLLVYDRAAGTPLDSTSVTEPLAEVRGPATGMMFVAGVASDPRNRELFAVNNDIGDRMEVFPSDAEGNTKPKRILFVPHGSWGVALNQKREEVAITVEHANTIVVYRRDATLGDAPLRVLHGSNTGLQDPHGIIFDEAHNEISVANHGNWAPLTRAESLQGELKGGKFDLPSITTYAGDANEDQAPIRKIQGKHTELNWPMGIALDPVHEEIAVASYGNDSISIFRRDAQGDITPIRTIGGSRTGIAGPMGVSIDTKNDEIWVTNYREHTAAVFARTAKGNVAPKRLLRNAPSGSPAVGFGNPGAVSYDSKRDQILVPN
jgi:DNA-binding beta-propeller fold protein YncE